MNSFFHLFIHPATRKDELIYAKVRMLVAALLFFLFTLIFYTLFFIANGEIMGVKAIFNYVGIIAISATLVLLKISSNYKNALRTLSITGLMLITISIYLSGGIFSNDLYWFIVTTLTSAMLISLKDGYFNFVFSLTAIIIFYLAETLNTGLIPDPATEITSGIHYKFVNTLFILIILSLLTLVLIKNNLKLQSIKQKLKEQLVREQISSDFHDQIGNQLASISHLSKLLSSTTKKDLTEELTTKIQSYADEVYLNFKDFIWTQNPDNSNLEELYTYIKDFAENYFSLSNIQLYSNSNLAEMPSPSILPDLAKEIIPFMKEVMANALKHSNATKFELDFEYSNSILTINTKDNGEGFDTSQHFKSNGLKNLSKRAKKMKATLSIHSSSNGTAIGLIVKLT